MYYLYASKPGRVKNLVATFDSEQQLLAYVRWATLSEQGGVRKFEQGSSLAGYQSWSYEQRAATEETRPGVDHNPSPSML
jgi:hypothetical protein